MTRKKTKEKDILPDIKVEEIVLPSNVDTTKLAIKIESLILNQQSMSNEIIKLKKALIFTQKKINELQIEIQKNKKL